MKLDTLDTLKDEELKAVIDQCQALLNQRDEDRKAKALNDARAILASVGLSLKELNGKGKNKAAKAPVYRTGHTYQHPTEKALAWNAKGQKPNWLRELEAEGRKPIEIPADAANDNLPPSLKKVG